MDTPLASSPPASHRLRRARHGLLLAVLLLTGCASLGLRPKAPDVALESITAAAIGPGGARARIRLAASNPNPYDLGVASLDYMITLDGRSVGGGTLVQPVTLVAAAITPVDLDVRVDLIALGAAIERASRRGNIPYEVSGDMVLLDGTRLPFRRNGYYSPMGRSLAPAQ